MVTTPSVWATNWLSFSPYQKQKLRTKYDAKKYLSYSHQIPCLDKFVIMRSAKYFLFSLNTYSVDSIVLNVGKRRHLSLSFNIPQNTCSFLLISSNKLKIKMRKGNNKIIYYYYYILLLYIIIIIIIPGSWRLVPSQLGSHDFELQKEMMVCQDLLLHHQTVSNQNWNVLPKKKKKRSKECVNKLYYLMFPYHIP